MLLVNNNNSNINRMDRKLSKSIMLFRVKTNINKNKHNKWYCQKSKQTKRIQIENLPETRTNREIVQEMATMEIEAGFTNWKETRKSIHRLQDNWTG